MAPVARYALAAALAFLSGCGVAAAEGLLGAAPPASAQPPQSNGGAASQKPPKPGSPSAFVRRFYDASGPNVDPSSLELFVDPARAVLVDAAALRKAGQGECLDGNLALDTLTTDKTTVAKSLRMTEVVRGDDAKVLTVFEGDGDEHTLQWTLKKRGKAWKIADILSVTGEWALSQYHCK